MLPLNPCLSFIPSPLLSASHASSKQQAGGQRPFLAESPRLFFPALFPHLGHASHFGSSAPAVVPVPCCLLQVLSLSAVLGLPGTGAVLFLSVLPV